MAIIATYALMLCVVKFTCGYSPFVLTIRVTVHSQIIVFSFLTISGRLVQVIPWFTYLLNRWEDDLVYYLRSLCIQIFYKLAKAINSKLYETLAVFVTSMLNVPGDVDHSFM